MELLVDLLKQFIAAVPRIAGAFALIIIGWIVAKIVSRIVRKVLVKMNIDKLGEKLNEIEMIEKSSFQISFSTVISKVIYYILFLIFLIAGSDVLGMAVVSELIAELIAYFPKLLSAMIFIVIGLLVANFIKNIVSAACTSLKVPGGKVISGFIFYFILINVLLSAMKQAEINIDFLSSNLSLVFGGIILAFAIGYGFASKDMMANLLASIYSKGKFNLGDQIRVGTHKGEIVGLDSSSVTIKTDGTEVVIPLSHLASDVVEKF